MTEIKIDGYSIYPLTPDRWKDVEALFGEHGACGGCWCMFWRLTNKDFKVNKGIKNKEKFYALVQEGVIPGLLIYDQITPIGWVSLGPREQFIHLSTSRILKPVDTQPVWSVVCFFIIKQYRKKGVTTILLKAAIEYAKSQGAKILEGYPNDLQDTKAVDTFVYMGVQSAFLHAGFSEVARRSPKRPIMRYQ